MSADVHDGDTIFALSSGAPPAAIAVMRVSGPVAGDALVALAGRLPTARRASLRMLRGRDGEVLDRALVLWLPGPETATGEDLAELHLHGGRATIEAVEGALRREGLRRARGGEFTRRALKHGCIDLAQAEGLADLLAAETETERRMALATSEGQLSRALQGWYDRLTHIAAEIEARLDHADEGDVVAQADTVAVDMRTLLGELTAVLARPTVERLRNGPTIVLAGPPNAGKSSLFNALVERDAAIVTPVAGTTRDVLDASVRRRGRVYRIIDTAGINDATDPVERIGVERARAAAEAADLTLWLGDTAPGEGEMWINARCDLPGRGEQAGTVLNVSVYDPTTIQPLWACIEKAVHSDAGMPFVLSDRQQCGAAEVVSELELAVGAADDLIMAEHVRRSLSALDAVVGRHSPEAVLDSLFSRFCIGK